MQAANTLLDAWQLEEARHMAEALLVQAPHSAPVQLLAAEVLHQQGRHLEALALWRSARHAVNSRSQALGPVLRASAGYAPHFFSVDTPHFIIRGMNKDCIVATYARAVLESAYSRIGADLGFLPAERDEKIVVEIYPDVQGLAGATGLTFKEIETSGTIAVCKFHRLMIISPLATADGYAWADTLAHEFVHLIVSKRSGNNMPIWLHEGIAKYFESRWHGPAGQALTPYSEKLLARAVAKQKFISFAQMHPSMAKLPSQDDAALAFAEVFTVIEFIVHEHGTAAVATLLRLVGEGIPLEQALTQVLHMGFNQLEAAWKRSLRHRTFRNAAQAQPHPVRFADAPSNTSNTHEARAARSLEDMQDKQVHDWARLGELLLLRHRPKAAILEYEKAIAKSGTRYGSLVNQLARAYVDVSQIEAANTLLKQSLAQHPDDSDAHLLAGRIALKNTQWADAQAHFEAVRLQNPFNPEIHAALATLYGRAAQTEAQAQETSFLQQASQPRPAVDTSAPSVQAPPLQAGFGALRVVSQPWRLLRLDTGTTLQSPLWDVPLAAGPHDIADAATPSKTTRVHIDIGKTQLLNLTGGSDLVGPLP